jgi:hypothetical protein
MPQAIELNGIFTVFKAFRYGTVSLLSAHQFAKKHNDATLPAKRKPPLGINQFYVATQHRIGILSI